MQKLRINGLKLSEELVLLRVEAPADGLAQLSRLLGNNQINILFMTTAAVSDRIYGYCCIDSDKAHAVEALINQAPQLASAVRMISGVGLLTLFPHQSNLRMMGLALECLGKHRIGIHALASSIATVTFVIDYHRLDDVAEILTNCFELPQSATPARSILRVRAMDRQE
jgi:aspartokinase